MTEGADMPEPRDLFDVFSSATAHYSFSVEGGCPRDSSSHFLAAVR